MMKKRLWLRWMLAAVAAWLVFTPLSSSAEGGALVLPASMTVIEEEAFLGGGQITAVVLPDNLQRIESRAFSGVSVSEVYLPSSIVFIADDAFDDTVSFTAEAGSYGYLWAAAKGCRINGSIVTDFQFTDHGDGTCEVSGYTGSENDILIPEMSELGWVVNGIGENAFLECSGLTSVTIPDSVVCIGSSAFKNCSGLTSITIPESVASIGSSAFYKCRKLNEIHIDSIASWLSINYQSYDSHPNCYSSACHLYIGNNEVTSITIPSSVTSIGDYAFYHCSSLTSITIPEGVTSIGSAAFYYCSSLTSITILDGVTSIGSSTFSGCSSLTSITLPEGVTSIGSYAFSSCSSLTSITIPESVMSIGSDAFVGTSSLNEIYIDSIESWLSIDYQNYSSHPNYDSSACHLYIGNNEVTSITIPSSVTSIGSYAFPNCSSLTSITIPEGVTSIGSFAFSSCSSLTSITIPSSVTSIGSSAFDYCTSLTSITIPEGVTSIEYEAFRNCSSLTSITIPESVTCISHFAFSSCSSLTGITIPEGVTSIGNWAFVDCSSLTSITIPGGVTSFGGGAFQNCSSLTSITLSEGVTSIGSNAFYGCNNLTSITIPEGVTSIGSDAFYNCSSLTSITIPESVTSIGYEAFSNCSSLISISLLDGVTSIGSNAFSNCPAVKYASIGSQGAITLSANGYSFRVPDNQCNLRYIFSGNVVTELRMRDISKDVTGVVIPEGVTSIGSYAFYNCSVLTSVTIPSSVAVIGDSAFRGCIFLTSITIPDVVTSIGSNAFNNCPAVKYANIGPQGAKTLSANGYDFRVPGNPCNLRYIFNGSTVTDLQMTGISKDVTSVIIPDGVTWIGDGAFEDCTALTYVFIPDSVKRIGSSAFRNCRALTRFSIPGSVVNIGSNAFAGCVNLTILCDSGSSAETYAVNLNIPYLIQHTQTYPPMPEELRDQIRDLMLNRMGDPIPPELVFSVLQADQYEHDWHAHLVMTAVDLVNFNFSDLDYEGNKADYLFLDAIKRCGTDKKTNYIDVARYAGNSFIMIEDVVDDGGTVGVEIMARNLVDGFKELHPDWVDYITERGFADDFDSVMMDFFKGEMPASQLSAHMNVFGLGTPESFWQDAEGLYEIKETKQLLEGYKLGAFVCRSAMDLANRLKFMESLDLVKLRAIGKIYQQSNDATVRRVGTDIVSFCDQDRAGRAVMLVSGWLSNTVMDLVSDVIGDMIQSVISTEVMLTNLAVNVFFGADEIPEHIFEMEFAASAVRTSYQALQNAYQAYQQNPSDANFNTVFWAYVNYYEIIASAESSFVEMYELLLNTPVGNMLMGDDWRDVVQTARIAVASASLLASNITVQYSLWETGDYEAFQAGMQQAYAEYEQAMSGI